MTNHFCNVDITLGNPVERLMKGRKVFLGLDANNGVGLQLLMKKLR